MKKQKTSTVKPMSSVLLIFIKNPRLGRVKTRLAQTVGDAEALRIYHLLLEKTRLAALAAPVQRWLFYSEKIERNDGWDAQYFFKKRQQGADLGVRMAAAFRQAFEAGATRAVIIGSDCPDVNGALLETAFAKLEQFDFVLGPSLDGGYYLLGMTAFDPVVFENIPWSTDTVQALTLERIQALGKTCFLLPELNDIDTAGDWKLFLKGQD